MDTRSELARERVTLAKADADLRQGQARVAVQKALVVDLSDAGADAREAERLLDLLVQTLDQWRRHRALIEQRISYLEARSASEARAGSSVDAPDRLA